MTGPTPKCVLGSLTLPFLPCSVDLGKLRRFMRLTNGFSRKLENLRAAAALCKILPIGCKEMDMPGDRADERSFVLRREKIGPIIARSVRRQAARLLDRGRDHQKGLPTGSRNYRERD